MNFEPHALAVWTTGMSLSLGQQEATIICRYPHGYLIDFMPTTMRQAVLAELGEALPKSDPHGVSVSLPTWENTRGWARRDRDLVKKMKTGYPRFFYQPLVVQLGEPIRAIIHESKLSQVKNLVDELDYPSVLVFACPRYAYDFISYVKGQPRDKPLDLSGTVECYFLKLGHASEKFKPSELDTRPVEWASFELTVILHQSSEELTGLAKNFWMHTGFGISSRYAEICQTKLTSLGLQRLPTDIAEVELSGVWFPSRKKKHFGALKMAVGEPKGSEAKAAIRERLAGLHSRPGRSISAEDVLLYPTGMAAITEAAGALKAIAACSCTSNSTAASDPPPIVAYGFLYVDTFKTIQRIHLWETILHGQASSEELDKLETYLQSGKRISGLFVEVPGNPLLRTPDLVRLRGLANEYKFPIVIDDTIGTPVNLSIIRYADVVATSLTKMFSGVCNVMGGSLLLNPDSPFHDRLKAALESKYIDTWFPQDAVVMDTNSRNSEGDSDSITKFETRVRTASTNAASLASLLSQSSAVKHVFYPKGSDTQPLYDRIRKSEDSGYGFLLSVDFVKPGAAMAFFDALQTEKGPSLGTEFTLACPYTLLAHWNEREWAALYGVGEYLVRISVGCEEEVVLRGIVRRALEAAEAAEAAKGAGKEPVA